MWSVYICYSTTQIYCCYTPINCSEINTLQHLTHAVYSKLQIMFLSKFLLYCIITTPHVSCIHCSDHHHHHQFLLSLMGHRASTKRHHLVLLVDVSLIIQFKVCRLLAHSTRAWWWGCHLKPSSRLFSVRVVSLSLWRSLFTTRQWFLLYLPQEEG
jgi:hypothetical protein